MRVAELGQITGALKEYSEILLRKLQPERSEQIIGEQDRKLEQGRLGAFRREPMIDFLIRQAGDQGAPESATPERLYEAFRKSKDPESFLKASGYSSDFIEQLMRDHSTYARRDYVEIGQRFFGREPTLHDVQEDRTITDKEARELLDASVPSPRSRRRTKSSK